MKRIQFILSLILLITLTTCQSDVAVDSKEKIASTVSNAADQAKEVAEKIQDEATLNSDTEASTSEGEPKLLEFYVEEDKEAIEKEKKAKAKSTALEAEPKKKAVVTKKKTTAKSKKRPKMKFENNTFAFGIIKPGEVIEHKFEFTNTGETDLVITDAKATCGCTQPSFPFVPIPPGEKGFIGVKYDSTGKLGSQKPTVTLTTNAYPNAQKVYLEGVVISEMSKN